MQMSKQLMDLKDGTGTARVRPRRVRLSFHEYDIYVRVSEDKQPFEVVGIEIRRSSLNTPQPLATHYHHNANDLLEDCTGHTHVPEKIVPLPFQEYVIHVRVSEDNQPLDVVGVEVKKNFLSTQQRLSAYGYHDVNDLYEVS
jgi:hypothetical protein